MISAAGDDDAVEVFLASVGSHDPAAIGIAAQLADGRVEPYVGHQVEQVRVALEVVAHGLVGGVGGRAGVVREVAERRHDAAGVSAHRRPDAALPGLTAPLAAYACALLEEDGLEAF